MQHKILDKRTLSFARLVVWKIDHDPQKQGLEVARRKIQDMKKTFGSSYDIDEWERILSNSWNEIRKLLLEKSERMQFLRQSTPFLGPHCLPQDIRSRIIQKYKIRYGKSGQSRSPHI